MKEAEEALRNSWKAVREHQQYYQKLTLEKSREHTVGASGTAGAASSHFCHTRNNIRVQSATLRIMSCSRLETSTARTNIGQ